MKTFIEKQLVRLLLSRGGPIIQKAVTALAAAAVTYVSGRLGLDVAALGLNEAVLAGIIWAVIDIAVTKLPASILKDYGTQLQKLLNAYSQGTQLKVDGYVGPKTLEQAATELKIR
jgi:peptidoglycan hydrolase-like protein with peptidoglycan-binding domain